MLFEIHNLPVTTRYGDIKDLLKNRCGLTEFIMDNLMVTKNARKVTIGLASEEDAAVLKRKINGFKVDGHQLYIEDFRQKPSEQPSRAPMGSGTQDLPAYNIPSQLQPPRNDNPTQYIPNAPNYGNFGQSWMLPTVPAQLGGQTTTNNNPQLVQYPSQKFGQTSNYGPSGANQNQGWGSDNSNQDWRQNSHYLGWGNNDNFQGLGENNPNQGWETNQNQSWGANNQQSWGSNNQTQGWGANNQNSGSMHTNQIQGWGPNNQKLGSGANNQDQGWMPNKANDRSQNWKGNTSNQGSFSGGQTSWSDVGSQGRRSQASWEKPKLDNEPPPRNRSPHESRPNRPPRLTRPEPKQRTRSPLNRSGQRNRSPQPHRQQSAPSRFNNEHRERSREYERDRPASAQTDKGKKRRWDDGQEPSGSAAWRQRPASPPNKFRLHHAGAGSAVPVSASINSPNPQPNPPPKKKVTRAKLLKRNEFNRNNTVSRIIFYLFDILKLDQKDAALKFYFKEPVRARLDKVLGDTIDAPLDKMYEQYMSAYKRNEDQVIYEEAKRLQTEDKKLDQFLDVSEMKPSAAEEDAIMFLRPYLQKPAPQLTRKQKKKKNQQLKKILQQQINKQEQQNQPQQQQQNQPQQQQQNQPQQQQQNQPQQQKQNQPQQQQQQSQPLLSIHKIPSYINGSKKQFKEMKQKHMRDMRSLECPQLSPKYEKIIDKKMEIIQQMFRKIVEESDEAAKRYYKSCPVNTLALDFTKTVKQNICQRLTNTGIKMIRIYGHPRLPNKQVLEQFLSKYGALSLKKSQRKFLYTAVINNYTNYDLLCNMEMVNMGAHSASFKPLHVAPKIPRKTIIASLGNKRVKYIQDQIKKPRVNILDKDWQTKQAAIDEEEKNAKKDCDKDAANSGNTPKTQKTKQNKTSTDKIKSEENVKTNSEKDIKNQAIIENTDQKATTSNNQDIDFTADVEHSEFAGGKSNQFAEDNQFVSDNSILKEYTGVSEHQIIFDDDDDEQEGEKGDGTKVDAQQWNEDDGGGIEYDDEDEDVMITNEIDLDNINDDDLEDY